MCAVLNLSSPSLTRTVCCLSLLVLFATGSAWAQTTTDPTPACAKVSSNFPAMTYDEDNRYLSSPDCRTELFDRLKFMPLRGEDENYYLSFGVVSRDRGEYFSENTWGSGPAGNAYLMQRYYGHLDLHLGERFRLFGEVGSRLETGRKTGARPSGYEHQIDNHSSFVYLGVPRSG